MASYSFKNDTKSVWVQAEALSQSRFYISDNVQQRLRYLKNQANKQKRLSFEPIFKPFLRASKGVESR